MTGRKKRLGFAVFAALVVNSAAAFAADVVVLDSTVASIDAGAVIPEEAQIEIPAGSSVTLIMANGETRTLGGPYAGAIGATVAETTSGLEAFTSVRGGDTKVLGAVRAPKWEVAE